MNSRRSYLFRSRTFAEECAVGAVRVESRGVITRTDEKGLTDSAQAKSQQAEAGSRAVTPDRYSDRGLIARGGMGEVRRVRDRYMHRSVAMKLLSWELVGNARARMRFLREARLTAFLEHPGVIPVYDRGKLPNGRLWYTMREIDGSTLRSVIEALHSGQAPQWTLRRVVRIFHRMCEAVAYAHDQGVVHRDLKPANLMVGRFGEALVLDWGLAKRIPTPRHAEYRANAEGAKLDACTHPGTTLGTPAYMAPEQRAPTTATRPTADVYSLGAILFEVATGRAPIGDFQTLPPTSVRDTRQPSMFDDLLALARNAMATDPSRRPTDAGHFAQQLLSWLDNDHKTQQVERLLEDADRERNAGRDARSIATDLQHEARRQLSAIRSSAPVEQKAPVWRMLDDAANWEREAALSEVRWLQTLGAALRVDPDSHQAHRRLADHYAVRLTDAQRCRETTKAAEYQCLLREHDRGEHAQLLNGRATFSLETDPAGAEVVLFRHAESRRRLILVPCETFVAAPPHHELEPGSYLAELSSPGRHTVRVPLILERGSHSNRVAPGNTDPAKVHLPVLGQLAADDILVTAGWFRCGGDALAIEPLSTRDVWVDDFVVKQFPVTHAQYLDFLNALWVNGERARALSHVPLLPISWTGTRQPGMAYRCAKNNGFELAPPTAGLPWALDQPVTMVTWYDACAYASWYSQRTGRPWRLPNELEWEKAARGVDGRLVSWGDHIEPTHAAMIGSHDGIPTAVSVQTYPEDVSPYGVRGLVGNVRDWCLNEWEWDGPAQSGERLHITAPGPVALGRRSVKGGCWSAAPDQCRAAARFAMPPGDRLLTVGFRLVRSSTPSHVLQQ